MKINGKVYKNKAIYDKKSQEDNIIIKQDGLILLTEKGK